MTQKDEIRKYIKTIKNDLREDVKIASSRKICKLIEDMPIFQSSHNILAYHSLADEVITHEFILKWNLKKCIYLPRIFGEDIYLAKYKSEENLCQGKYGIMEPLSEIDINLDKIDVAIIPAVAISKKGNRIGRGKGYYDKLLSRQNIGCKIGIIYSFQLCDDFNPDTHDIPMDYIVTEKGILKIN